VESGIDDSGLAEKMSEREFGIKESLKKLNRQLEKVADSFGYINDI